LPVVLRAGLLFFLNAFLLGSFLSRVPDVLTRLETDKAALGFALFAAPVGSVIATLFVGRLIDARTPGTVAIGSGVLLSLAIGLVGQALDVLMLALFLFIAGIINGVMEVSMNAAADRVEKQTGAKILARCHGFWSLGFMCGALVAGGAAQAGISDTLHLLGVAVFGVAGVLAARTVYPASAFVYIPPRPDAPKPPAFALPNRLTIGLCLMGVGVTLAEGAVYDWGTLYLRAEIGAAPLHASVAFASFTLAMAIGRFSGDVVRERFAAPAIVRTCAVLTGIGLLGFLASPNAVVGGLALVVMGVGVSLVFPIAVTAVSTKEGASPASNIAALSLSVMAALLTGPPVIGVASEAFGLTIAFLLTLPAIAMTFVFANQSSVSADRVRVIPQPVGDRA
jgi:MFS family permease